MGYFYLIVFIYLLFLLIFLLCSFYYSPIIRRFPGNVLFFILLSVLLSHIFTLTLIIFYKINETSLIIVDDQFQLNQSNDTSVISKQAVVDFLHYANEMNWNDERTAIASYLDRELPDSSHYFFLLCIFFRFSISLWYLMLSLDLILALLNPFLPFHSCHWKHHLLSWPISILYTTFAVLVVPHPYIAESATHSSFYIVFLIFNLIPRLTVLSVIIISFAIANHNLSKRLENRTHLTTLRMYQRILPYLFIFASGSLLMLLCFAFQLLVLFTKTSCVIACEIIGQIELMALLIWFIKDNQLFQHCLRRKRRDPISNGTHHLSQQSSCPMLLLDSIPTSIQHEFAPDHQILEIRPTEESGRISIPPETSNERQDDIAHDLRQDIMRYTSMAIFESISCLNQNYPVTNNRLLEPAFGYDEYTKIQKLSIVVHGTRTSFLLHFYDHAPLIFENIRNLSGIPRELYQSSFNIHDIMKEHGSEGKSGNLFYFTVNHLFLVKTVPEEEYLALLHFLPNYHHYLQINPKTYLCKYYGCYRITLPVGKKLMYFIVMENIFASSNALSLQRFDLKGNTDRRQSISSTELQEYIHLKSLQKEVRNEEEEEKRIKKKRQYQKLQTKLQHKLLLDIEFLTLKRGLHVSESEKIQLIIQLQSDILFLASNGIMDYSVLLGIEKVEGPIERNNISSIQKRERIISLDNDESYLIGIIDILQQYNWKWNIQRYALAYLLCKDIHNLSAVPPTEYATRLLEFIHTRLFESHKKYSCISIPSSDPRTSSALQPVRYSSILKNTTIQSKPVEPEIQLVETPLLEDSVLRKNSLSQYFNTLLLDKTTGASVAGDLPPLLGPPSSINHESFIEPRVKKKDKKKRRKKKNKYKKKEKPLKGLLQQFKAHTPHIWSRRRSVKKQNDMNFFEEPSYPIEELTRTFSYAKSTTTESIQRPTYKSYKSWCSSINLDDPKDKHRGKLRRFSSSGGLTTQLA